MKIQEFNGRKYQIFSPGDKIHYQAGDVWVDNDGNGVGSKDIGSKLSRLGEISVWYVTARPIADAGWIKFSDRKPTKEDSYQSQQLGATTSNGKIAVIFNDGSLGSFDWNCNLDMGAYWKPLVAPKQKEDTIYIMEGTNKREVVINKGEVLVGCVKIDAETAKKIANKIIEVLS